MRNVVVAILTLAAMGPAQADEGVVRVYVSLDREHSERVLKRFEKQTGIKVDALFDTEATKTVGPVRQLISEKQNPQCDVYWNNELATTVKLKEYGILAKFVPKNAADIPAEFKDPEGYWTGFAARARVLIVNTNLVKKSEMPTSMWDLADPKWKGKACMARPQTGTTAAHAAALFVQDKQKAEEYFAKLARNDVVWLTGNAHCMRDVSAGRFAFGWTDTDDFNVARLQGRPVAMVYPDKGNDDIGVMYIPNSLVLIKGGPNAINGKRLIEWLLRPEIEALLARSATAQIPVRPGVEVPDHVRRPDQIGKTMPLDWDQIGKQYDLGVETARAVLASPEKYLSEGGAEADKPSYTLFWIAGIVIAVGVVGFLLWKKATAEPS